MHNYDVYFEIYGKKLKATVYAASEESAKQKIFDKIIFHKITSKPSESNKSLDEIMEELMDVVKGKKQSN